MRFRQGARARAFARLIGVRLVLAPMLGALALTFAALEPALWRRVVLVTVVTVLWIVSVVEFVRHRRGELGREAVPLNLALMVSGQLGLVVATGGLLSPVLPPVVVLSAAVGLLADARLASALVFGLQIPTLWVLALVHWAGWPVSLVTELLGGWSPAEASAAPWIYAAVLSVVLGVGRAFGAGLRSLYEDVLEDALRERDRSLHLLQEHTKALTTLGGEIGHELKNPLASVKGLAALVARDVEGRTAERLGVLRREVDRMQGVLDEFLNFSRPLVPLSCEETDLAQLAEDVAALHEAVARERGVQVRVQAHRGVSLRCDPRKVRQVLINLLQNAIDASPEGGAVDVRVDRRDGDPRLEVLDEGPGLDPGVAERVFEAGVTTKDRGSGLGLPMARSLARQHGGDLVLTDRPTGGCRALLTLPPAPEPG